MVEEVEWNNETYGLDYIYTELVHGHQAINPT